MKRTPLARKTPMRNKSPMRKSRRKKMTRSEKFYANRVAALGCIACMIQGTPGTPPELHHPRYNAGAGQRSAHADVIPLCPPHHRGTMHPQVPSIHLAPERFIAAFGDEQSLVARVKAMAA